MKRLFLDRGLIFITLALAGLSLALIWSTNPNFFIPQLIFYILGFIIFVLVSQLNSDLLENFVLPFYLLSIVLLIISLLNAEIRGASRWIEIFGMGMQPSELVKPFLIVSFAYFINKINFISFLSFFKYLALFILPLLIIYLQPDLGNVIIYGIFLAMMFFANQLDYRILIAVALIIIIGSPLLWNILHDYQRLRIISFISPQNDPLGAGYNAIQAMIAVGSGGIFGQGLGRGNQSHLRFLPENHTDFIFASLTEELGLLGAIFLLSFYTFIFIKLLNQARETTNKFHYLIIIGIFMQIFSQVFINISMNIGLVPITGITLPLLSSGGSSVISTFISLGFLVSLEKDKEKVPLVIR